VTFNLFIISYLRSSQAHQDHSTAFTCRVGIGNCYKATGQLQKAIDVLTLELEFAKTQRDEIGEAIVCCSLSKCYSSFPFSRETFEENMKKALTYAERDVVLSAKHSSDFPAQLGAAHCQLASCLRKGGDHEKAKEFFDSAVQLLREGDDQPSRLMALIEFATMILTEGAGQELPPGGPPTLELAHSLAIEALSQSKALKDKDNTVLSLCLAHRSTLASPEIKAAFFESIFRDKENVCPICNSSLDYKNNASNNEIFVAMNSCRHAYHRQCFADWVSKDNLRCPVEGCTLGSDLLKHFKEDPSVVLRLARGELHVMNYF
jgi:tetratricopeptide (TPR) repeat protein